MANSDFIERRIDQVYSSMTREQRAELCNTNSELHSSVISDNFQRIALMALKSAKTQWSPIAQNISRDDLHMLRRALEYAQYIVARWRLIYRLRWLPGSGKVNLQELTWKLLILFSPA